MFPEVEILMQYINDEIEVFSEEKDNEVLRSAETGPKRENVSTGINRLVISFAANKYKPGIFLMKKKESKD